MPKTRLHRTARVTGVTLIELLVALAIMGVVTATLLPILAAMRNHWGATMAASEITQHARVLFDHLHRELAQAQTIVALSAPEDPAGFLEFRSQSGKIVRYDKTQDENIRFGPPGSLASLVAAVESFHVLGYDPKDHLWPARDPNRVRLVEVQVTFARGATLGHQRTWQGVFFVRSDPPDPVDRHPSTAVSGESAPAEGTDSTRAQRATSYGTPHRERPCAPLSDTRVAAEVSHAPAASASDRVRR